MRQERRGTLASGRAPKRLSFAYMLSSVKDKKHSFKPAGIKSHLLNSNCVTSLDIGNDGEAGTRWSFYRTYHLAGK